MKTLFGEIPMDKQALIDQKIATLTKELEQWAKNELGIEPGRMLMVKVEISFRDVPVAKVGMKVRGQVPGRYAKQSDEPLTEDDWKRIEALSWRTSFEVCLRGLKQRSGFFAHAFSYAKWQTINRRLRNAGLPYRLVVYGKGNWFERNSKMCKVVF